MLTYCGLANVSNKGFLDGVSARLKRLQQPAHENDPKTQKPVNKKETLIGND